MKKTMAQRTITQHKKKEKVMHNHQEESKTNKKTRSQCITNKKKNYKTKKNIIVK